MTPPTSSPSAIVAIILDEKQNRLRAKAVGVTGFIRFPKRLREVGAIYRVERLIPLYGGRSWCACGEIKRVA